MLDNVKKVIGVLIEIGIVFLVLVIVVLFLVGLFNMVFLGDVVGNIIVLVL